MSVVVLTGGVGGAKLVEGLAQVLPAGELTAIVNTADDFTHLSLRISPDIDSVIYMLSGRSDPVRGWGVAGETWQFMTALSAWGGENWFNLGDLDLAMHVLRTHALSAGSSLTAFTALIARAAGVGTAVVPMTDDVVSTTVETDIGTLAFQEYFVRHHCHPAVRNIRFEGVEGARPSSDALESLASASIEAVILAPSNPYLSIDPILSVPGLRAAIKEAGAPVVAVSPIVGGEAVKGPTTKLMREMRVDVTNVSIAAHYAGLLDGLVIDRLDSAERLPLPTAVLDTQMGDAAARRRVAELALALARALR